MKDLPSVLQFDHQYFDVQPVPRQSLQHLGNVEIDISYIDKSQPGLKSSNLKLGSFDVKNEKVYFWIAQRQQK